MDNNELRLSNAYQAFSVGDYNTAKMIFEELANNGVMRAHLYLGWIYDQGLGVRVNLSKAESHYKLLSEANDADGKYYLASLFKKQGRLESALTLYEVAADLEHVSAAYWAYILNLDSSSSVDAHTKANYYLNRAASLGHIFAQRDLLLNDAITAKRAVHRLMSRIKYWILKIKGTFLILKNSQDLRVR
jgi:TPR repeat protein